MPTGNVAYRHDSKDQSRTGRQAQAEFVEQCRRESASVHPDHRRGWEALVDVRCDPKLGHIGASRQATRWAKLRHMQYSKERRYSMTSSAVASKEGGTVRPSVFAVLRLTTSSYLVGACTGRSAGFAPLRMRST